MTVELRHRLCDRLLRLDPINDREIRNLYFAALKDQFGQPVNLRRYSDARHDIWSLLDACSEHPGLLHSFATIIRGFFGDSPAMSEVQQLVDEIDTRLPTEEDRLANPGQRMPIHQITSANRTAIAGSHTQSRSGWDGPIPAATTIQQLEDSSPSSSHRHGSSRNDRATPQRSAVRMVWGSRSAESAGTLLDSTDEQTSTWGGVPLRNPHFVGRIDLLRTLRANFDLHPPTSVLPQVLHGLGGVGKSQLATEYAHSNASMYQLIWWLPAKDPQQVTTALAQLGAKLGLHHGLASDTDPACLAQDTLSALAGARYRWLLIYDDATSPHDLSSLIPSFGGHVLLTTRDSRWISRCNPFAIDAFDRRESVELIQGRGCELGVEPATRLANRLNDVPLAIAQALNFIHATGIAVEEYLGFFDKHSRDLLDQGRPSDHPTTFTGMVEASITEIRDNHPAASEVLDMFVFLGTAPTSPQLLRKGRSTHLSEHLQEALDDPIRLGRILQELSRHGLVSLDAKTQQITMNKLTQTVLRANLSGEKLLHAKQAVQHLLAAANPGDPDNQDSWPIHLELGPHILPADLIHSKDEDARQVALDQARFLFRTGKQTSSRDLSRAMVTAWSLPPADGGLGRDNEQTLRALRHLANALRMLGDYRETRRIDEEAYALLLASPEFGEDHAHTIDVALGLGNDLAMAGNLNGALQRDRENLDRAIRVHGAHHRTTRRARANVAASLRQLGRFSEAYTFSQDVVEQCRQVEGENHVSTLWNTCELVFDLYGLGRYQEALEIQHAVFRQFTMRLEPSQREYLLAERNLAIALRKTGDHAEALERTRDNYLATRQRFGSSHEYALAASMSHANALRTSGHLAEANEIGAIAVHGYRSTLGERHPLTLAAQVNFGIVLRLIGEQRAAHDLEHATFRTLEDVLGEEHPYTLAAANNYANNLVLEHQLAAASDLSQWVMQNSCHVRGEHHPDTLASMINSAFDTQALEGGAAGQSLFDRAISNLERVLGPEHPETVAARARRRSDCDIEPPPT